MCCYSCRIPGKYTSGFGGEQSHLTLKSMTDQTDKKDMSIRQRHKSNYAPWKY